jgi:hypothetical protein
MGKKKLTPEQIAEQSKQKVRKELSDVCKVVGWDSENNPWLRQVQIRNVIRSYEKVTKEYGMEDQEARAIMYDAFEKNRDLILKGKAIQGVSGNRNGVFGFLKLAEDYQNRIANSIFAADSLHQIDNVSRENYQKIRSIINYIKKDNGISYSE